ncbi:MAG: hypothetical protein J6Z79_00705 [Clostridia bacterium]|nr:hypothetical protein [Clostridia bacterium]
MERIKRYWLFCLLTALVYYILPIFPPFLSGDTGAWMILLLLVMPAAVFLISLFCGLKNGFRIWFPLFSAILFLPGIFLFFNESAWIYAPVYGVFSLLGELLALPFRKIRKK